VILNGMDNGNGTHRRVLVVDDEEIGRASCRERV